MIDDPRLDVLGPLWDGRYRRRPGGRFESCARYRSDWTMTWRPICLATAARVCVRQSGQRVSSVGADVVPAFCRLVSSFSDLRGERVRSAGKRFHPDQRLQSSSSSPPTTSKHRSHRQGDAVTNDPGGSPEPHAVRMQVERPAAEYYNS